MESIKEVLEGKTAWEKCKETKEFKQGVKDFKEGNVKQPTVKSFWVKKYIGQRDWKNFYSQNISYCNLGTEGIGKGKQVKVGFLVANQVPYECEECNDDEIRQIDDYRRNYSIRPFSLIDK